MQRRIPNSSDLSPTTKLLTASLAGLSALYLTRHLIRSRRLMNLSGKLVLIMGGSRGLGLALAREYARHHARLVLCARDEHELALAQDDLRRRGATVSTCTCDAADPQSVEATFQQIERTHGPIHVLVNVAGTILVGPAQTMTLPELHEVMNINFWSAVHTMNAVIPSMQKRGGGRIINVGSIGGKMPVPHLAAYCASKFALVGFSGALGAELKKDNILITIVNPGLMRTGSPRNARFTGNTRAEYAWFSIADSLPILSMSAATAARRIVTAGLYGDPEVTIGFHAGAAAVIYGLAPNFHLEIAALINHLLPQATALNAPKPGYQNESRLTHSFLRSLGIQAEHEYNQYSTP